MILQANSLPVARSRQRCTVEVEPTPVFIMCAMAVQSVVVAFECR
jgi:hypothetical protein